MSNLRRCSRRSAPCRSVLILVLLSCCASGYAERFEAKLFDQSSGLGDLSITALAQQSDGLLWVATQNGLFRYDGSIFTEYARPQGLTDPSVYSLLVDAAGNVWAGTHNGLFLFDGQRFHEIREQGHTIRIGMNSMLASTAAGELVAATPHGLVLLEQRAGSEAWTAVDYSRRHAEVLPFKDDTDGVGFDAQGRLWFGCRSGLCVDNTSGTGPPGVERYGVEQGVARDYYVSLFRASDGRMWARGRKHILTWRPGDVRIADVTAGFPVGGTGTVFRRFTEDAQGNILTPTARGFATWNGKQWKETVDTSLGPLEGASAVFSDREGALWIGTQGFGVLESLGYHRWQNYGVQQGLTSPSLLSIAEDTRGRMWFGHNRGADILVQDAVKGDVMMPSALNHEKNGQAVVSMAASADGGMWAATLLGAIYHLNAAGVVDFRTVLDGYIGRILIDQAGKLWIVSNSGLFTLPGKPHRGSNPLPLTAPALQGISITDMVIDPAEDAWVSSDHGLFRMHAGRVTAIGLPNGYSELETLARGGDGTWWLAGNFPGVLHIRVVGDKAYLLGTLTRPQLASDFIQYLGVDDRQRVWIGTDNGVNVLAGGKVLYLSHQDGLIWNVCEGHAFFAGSRGSVWLGTALGVSHVLHPAAALSRLPFAARIGTASYKGKDVRPGGKLPWGGGALVVHFTGITFRDNASLIYRYTLSGAATDAGMTSQPIASFEGLGPGSYVLRVVAEDSGHKVFSSPATLAFRLTPPWWRTLYFFALLGVLLIGLLRLLWRWRHRAMVRSQIHLAALVESRTRELEQMMLHDSLTGLRNRNAIFSALEQAYQDARSAGESLYVALIDIDHFKQVNDTYGHVAGDAVLREAAQRLSSAVRKGDMVGRYGGEEFLVVFRDATSLLDEERCEKLRRAVCEQPIPWSHHAVTVTCSIGVACIESEKETIMELLMRADAALYRAKQLGRNRVQVAA